MRRDMNEYQSMDVFPMATAQKVKTMIIQREMEPGDKLPTEKELADLFGVSRSALREAMKFLRAENVIVIRRGSGTFVNAGTGIGEDLLGLRFTSQEKLIQNLFETRMLIEPQIAGLACQGATPQDVRNLQLLATEMDRNEINSPASAKLDVQLRTAVAGCTHNEVLTRVVPIIIEFIRRSHVETHDDPESFKRVRKSHMGICKAITEGDFMEAKFQAERYVWETLNDVKETEERKWRKSYLQRRHWLWQWQP